MKNSLLECRTVASAVGALAAMAIALPAYAHHPFGGSAPQTLMQGFLSGLGHPVIGLDHLAFVIAAGLLAAVVVGGRWVPMAFIGATLAGTGLHLVGLDLPAAELVISTSVVIFGGLAVMRDRLNPVVVCLLAAIAGLFHGYAYGEAVMGAQASPLVAYLIGFAGVQGAIAYVAYLFSRRAIDKNKTVGLVSVRHAGFAVLGAGVAFLGGLVA
ncbi:MAG: HupE/UreJ family protein [Cyanobacteria bacterium J06559_1]